MTTEATRLAESFKATFEDLKGSVSSVIVGHRRAMLEVPPPRRGCVTDVSHQDAGVLCQPVRVTGGQLPQNLFMY